MHPPKVQCELTEVLGPGELKVCRLTFRMCTSKGVDQIPAAQIKGRYRPLANELTLERNRAEAP